MTERPRSGPVVRGAGDPGSYDVLVAGGGPAGAATALRLAAAGRSVAVVERGYDRPRIGETLAPSVQPLLRELGVWDRFTALAPLPSWGVRSVWADPDPAEHSHLASGWGSGWHVDRAAVDAMLAAAAAAAGAHVLTGTAVAGCQYDGATWKVACAGRTPLRARVLVDATGRRSAVGRLLGGRRTSFDRLVAVAATWAGRDVADDGHLLLEATGDGWWYTAPVPGGAMVAMLLTDADLCRSAGLADPRRWDARLRGTDATAARLGPVATRPDSTARRGRTPVPVTPRRNPVSTGRRDGPSATADGGWTPLRLHPAASHRLLRVGDPRPWLAVGDAALAVDPLSGSGVVQALRMADDAARTVGRLLDGADDAVTGYEAARDAECTTHLVERARHYGAVRRFTTPFWTRRALDPAA